MHWEWMMPMDLAMHWDMAIMHFDLVLHCSQVVKYNILICSVARMWRDEPKAKSFEYRGVLVIWPNGRMIERVRKLSCQFSSCYEPDMAEIISKPG